MPIYLSQKTDVPLLFLIIGLPRKYILVKKKIVRSHLSPFLNDNKVQYEV